jgi:drug/metabolite transporter (DMT)-like permease
MFNAEPVFTVLGAALLLGEHLGPGQVAGAVLVIAGVLLSTRAKS